MGDARLSGGHTMGHAHTWRKSFAAEEVIVMNMTNREN